MKIKLLSETYEITEKGTKKGKELKIFVEKKNDKITLTTHQEYTEFEFVETSKEMIKKIGKMIVRASDI